MTGLGFEEYIEKNIFSPLEMNNSEFISKNVNTAPKGYYKGRESKVFHHSAFFGCGDIISTTSDLKKFMESLTKGKIVNKNLVDKMKKVSASSKMGNYGYGVIVSDKLGEKAVGHGGAELTLLGSKTSAFGENPVV